MLFARRLLLAKGGHPKIVSEMLGCSGIAITLDTYSHVMLELGEAAISDDPGADRLH